MLFFFTPPKNATRYTLPKTNIFAPGNRWLEDDCFLFGWPIFRCYVRFGGDIYIYVCVCALLETDIFASEKMVSSKILKGK